MNLNRIAAGYVSAVNLRVQLRIQQSTGYATNADGSRLPTYAPEVVAWGQVQALQYTDIMMLDRLSVQGTRRAVYLEGDWKGLVRPEQRGGDLITFPDGSVWLVAVVLEHWDDWVKLAVTLQDGS